MCWVLWASWLHCSTSLQRKQISWLRRPETTQFSSFAVISVDQRQCSSSSNVYTSSEGLKEHTTHSHLQWSNRAVWWHAVTLLPPNRKLLINQCVALQRLTTIRVYLRFENNILNMMIIISIRRAIVCLLNSFPVHRVHFFPELTFPSTHLCWHKCCTDYFNNWTIIKPRRTEKKSLISMQIERCFFILYILLDRDITLLTFGIQFGTFFFLS